MRNTLGIAIAVCATVAIVLAGMLVLGTTAAPPPLSSVYDVVKGMDFSGAPETKTFRARDGVDLTYRSYPGTGAWTVVLIHGSTADSMAVHPMAKALNAAGFPVYAPDVRGHGSSGRRGDIEYIGQLDDDLADLVGLIRQARPETRLALVGFSAGGGFTLRVAGGPYGSLFERYVLLAPYLGHEAPTNRAGNGGWAVVYLPRIIAITLLNGIGIHWFDGMPVIAYAQRPDPAEPLPTYSFRLQANFRPGANYLDDFRHVTRPMTILVGEADDEMIAGAYAPAIHDVRPDIQVEVLPGIGHMEMTTTSTAIDAVVTALKR